MGQKLGCHVAVIGGGCAGLAAAARLAEHNIPVTLFEASHQLGGRARGVNWNNRRLDNGQHIMLGAYRETLRLLDLAGVEQCRAMLRIPLKLSIPGEFGLSACRLMPAPLHILFGLLLAKGLSLGERLAAIRFMGWMKLHAFKLTQDETLEKLLVRMRQPARVIKLLWEPLCLAALNTPLQKASAQVYLNVLRDSFSGLKSDSDMLLPRYDFSTLLAEPLAKYINQAGGKVSKGTAVTKASLADSGYLIELDNGTHQCFSHVVVAVPPFRVSALFEDHPELAGVINQCEQLRYQPIYTVYLQYPENVRLPSAMAGLIKGYGQWVFDRGLLYSQPQPGLLSVVISAEGPHQRLSQESLALEVSRELAQAFPGLPAPLWHKVIAEKRATFTCSNNLQRPSQETPLPGLYLAGDYTAGDYPATIEGAVRSGVICARKIITGLHGRSQHG